LDHPGNETKAGDSCADQSPDSKTWPFEIVKEAGVMCNAQGLEAGEVGATCYPLAQYFGHKTMNMIA
jgi:hypothetical protein